jgi:hypothetical protein
VVVVLVMLLMVGITTVALGLIVRDSMAAFS